MFLPGGVNPPSNRFMRATTRSTLIGDDGKKIQEVVLRANAKIGGGFSLPFFRQVFFNETACTLRSDGIEVLAANALKCINGIARSGGFGELQINRRSRTARARESVLSKINFNRRRKQIH